MPERSPRWEAPRYRPPPPPVLRFTPTAWAELLFFCHAGETEIGGFGISHPEDLLLVEDFQVVRQVTSPVTVAFDDAAVADYFDRQVDAGRRPETFARIWLHSHPGSSPAPSLVDEATFQRAFGACDWAVMFILARGGKTYARLRFNVGPGGSVLIPVEVDYTTSFPGSDRAAWKQAYDLEVQPESVLPDGLDEVGMAGYGGEFDAAGLEEAFYEGDFEP